MSDRLLLIDGHSIMNRAFYGLPLLTNSHGQYTNAVYGFLTILFKTLEEETTQYLAVAFDLAAPTFRHQMYPDYKGTRKAMPEELRAQIPLMQEVLAAMDVPVLTREGYEADDILGTLARQSEAQGMDVSILSGDRDLLQLATDHTRIRIPKTKGGQTVVEEYLASDVQKLYQVTPTQFIDVKALMGDPSDNIPGIPGVGEKTAIRLIAAYGSIENAHAHLDEIKPNRARESLRDHYDLALLSKRLAAIDTHVKDLALDQDAARLNNLYTQEALEYFRRLEFKNLLQRFSTDEEAHPLEETFVCLQTRAQMEPFLEEIPDEATVGLALLMEGEALLGAAICADPAHTAYLAVTDTFSADELKKLLQTLADRTLVAALDVKAVEKVIALAHPAGAFDAGVAAYLINPIKSSYQYDELAAEYLGQTLPSREERLNKLTLSQGIVQKPEQAIQILCFMAYVAQGVRAPLLHALEKAGMLDVFLEIEMPLVFTLCQMEEWGMRVDAEELQAYGKKLKERILTLEQEIYQLAGETFNLNSPKQLGDILFVKLNLPGGRKTKTGYSTAADILEKLAPDYEIVRDILEYRQLAKLKSTYADGLAACIASDGRIHSHFNQTITATGRISSTEPNLQNIPVRMELGRLIRKAFIPEEGYIFIDADYSQIELRLLAHMSEDEQLIEAYREGKDIHTITASQVFHVPFEEVTSLQRRRAKAVNFGIVYGISSYGLSQDLDISPQEASDYIASYFETYPDVKRFLEQLVDEAKERGYATTLFGRRRPIPELQSSNYAQRSFGERVAMNSPIQGTAADIIKIAMNRVQERLAREQLQSRLILQVHDELLLEVRIGEEEQVSCLLEEEMKAAASLTVELEVDMQSGGNWYEAK